MVSFFVPGQPVPKQSFQYTRNGGGFTDPRARAWETVVAWYAKDAMHGEQPLAGDLRVELVFLLPDRRRRDWDNLSKAVMDAMNKIVFRDDSQVTEVFVQKVYPGRQETHGVRVQAWRVGDKP
jgi:Holliday junction resolvase RusA-like endonuclease